MLTRQTAQDRNRRRFQALIASITSRARGDVSATEVDAGAARNEAFQATANDLVEKPVPAGSKKRTPPAPG